MFLKEEALLQQRCSEEETPRWPYGIWIDDAPYSGAYVASSYNVIDGSSVQTGVPLRTPDSAFRNKSICSICRFLVNCMEMDFTNDELSLARSSQDPIECYCCTIGPCFYGRCGHKLRIRCGDTSADFREIYFMVVTDFLSPYQINPNTILRWLQNCRNGHDSICQEA